MTDPAGRRPIVIAEYDPAWPGMAAVEIARLLTAVGPSIVALEHIGSTSVPGLAAKPVIDLMAGVRELPDAEGCIAPITALGYEYVPAFEAVMPDRRYFRRDTDGVRSHQIHLVAIDSPFWVRHVRFRDYLRAHPEWAHRYETLKRELAARHIDDVGAYTDGKTALIRQIEALAGSEPEA